MAIKKFDLVLQEKYKITPGTLHLVFTRSDGQVLDFIPGQFITFLLTDVDGTIKRRSYSIATVLGKSTAIEIAISEIKGGIATETLFNLEVGQSLHAMGPAGRLILKDEEVKRYVLVGTGTGVAPYRSMLPLLAKHCDNGVAVEILQGVQYWQDVLYPEDFIEFAKQSSNANFTACLSREDVDTDEKYKINGYVQSIFPELKLNPATDVICLCGNPAMIDDAFKILTELGFDSKNVRREKYISSN